MLHFKCMPESCKYERRWVRQRGQKSWLPPSTKARGKEKGKDGGKQSGKEKMARKVRARARIDLAHSRRLQRESASTAARRGTLLGTALIRRRGEMVRKQRLADRSLCIYSQMRRVSPTTPPGHAALVVSFSTRWVGLSGPSQATAGRKHKARHNF